MATMKGAAEELIPYRVTVKVNGQLPYDPYFEGQTGNAYPDFTCEVEAITEAEARKQGYHFHPATTPAMAQYPHPLRGETVRYEIQEI